MPEKISQGNEGNEIEHKVVNYESSSAAIDVSHGDKYIFISDLYSMYKGQGHGSGLLNKLKEMYPDYVIEGIPQPTEFTRPEKPSDKDMERAYDLGWDFAKSKLHSVGFELTTEELTFVKGVAEEYQAYKEGDPFLKLRSFYRNNGFDVNSQPGFVQSKPPHKIRQ